MTLALIPVGDLYRELAKLTDNKRLRMVYAKAHARAYSRERKKTAVGAAKTKELTAILTQG
jgi:hypothetical protein